MGIRGDNEAAQIPLVFDARPRAWSVSEIVHAASRTLEGQFGALVVEGEISNFRRPASGHLYFTLKDHSAQLPAVMWRSAAARLRFAPADGLCVRCHGSLGIYDAQGKFQLYAESMEPAGLGAAQLALEALKKKLAAEGLFAEERKRPVPFWPRRIGVVTSLTGAAVRDVIRVVHRRAGIPILVSPSPVQGEGAGAQLVRALRAVAAVPDVDVVILGRGGGSAEDLSAFNDEQLAREVAACRVPVISAVGHEIDFTLCDFVADLRAATPSMAGERAVPVAAEIVELIDALARRARHAATRSLREARHALEAESLRLGDPERWLGDARQRIEDEGERSTRAMRALVERGRRTLADLESRLRVASPAARLAAQREQLASLRGRLSSAQRTLLLTRRHALERCAGALQALSPLAVLDRGYALARTPEGALIADVHAVAAGDPLVLTLRDGELGCRVDSVRPQAKERSEVT